jgi:hypothetical protein
MFAMMAELPPPGGVGTGEGSISDVDAVLHRLAQAFEIPIKHGWETALAMALGLGSGGALGNWQRRGSINHATVIACCKERGISLDWVYTGEGAMMTKDRTPVEVFPLRRERGVPSPLERLRDARELIDKTIRDAEENEGRESGE